PARTPLSTAVNDARPQSAAVVALRRGCGGRLVERGALDLARLEHLEHVADLDVVEVGEVEAALEALLHLPRVVLEALQRVDRRRVDDRAVADDAHVRAAANDAACHHAARDRPDARGAEGLADLGLPDRLLRG